MYSCDACSSKKIMYHESIQSISFMPFIDENDRQHHHNKNTRYVHIKCNSCLSQSITPIFNTCWCGWNNENPDKIYHAKEIYPAFKGFGEKKIHITKDDWEINLNKIFKEKDEK